MQASPYSAYDDFYESILEVALSTCGISGNTTVPAPLYTEDVPLSCERTYTVKPTDDCPEIALIQPGITLISDLSKYNPWLKHDCSNLQSGSKVTGMSSAYLPKTVSLRRQH